MDFAWPTMQEMMVSRGSSLDAKELVRQAVDIVDLVGNSIQLRRQGRNFVGLCPWHDDSRPSLQVNPERQSFKCWVCDIGGDVFSFVMKMEGVSFPEALNILADRAGIVLEPQRRQQAEPGSPNDKRTLYRAMAWAEEQYHGCLSQSPEAEPARRYLQQRDITGESIEKFHLGFAPNRSAWILERARGQGFGPEILEAVGLVARPATGGSFYDRFRGRLLFSIRDPQGRPIGFGGRILPESGATSPAKYVNTPETPLFHKGGRAGEPLGGVLYALDVAKDPIRKSGRVLVTEGYTDCIVAHQYGFDDTVAVLGTALGEPHIRTLRRFADRIVLVLDGDEAGQRRANEVLELFVAESVDLRILTLPEGMDPCDFLQEHGAEAFADMLASRAVDALEHAFRAATRGVDLAGDIHGASQALERLVAIVARAPRLRPDSPSGGRLREERIIQRLAADFRMPEQAVRDRLIAVRRGAQRRAERSPAARRAATDSRPHPDSQFHPETGQQAEPPEPTETMVPWQTEMLEILLQFPDRLGLVRAEIGAGQVAAGPGRRVYETCCRLSDEGVDPTFDRLMLEFDDPNVKSLLVEWDERGRAKGLADPEALLKSILENYRKLQIEKQRPAQAEELRRGRHDEGTELLRRIVQQEKTRHGITDPTDG